MVVTAGPVTAQVLLGNSVSPTGHEYETVGDAVVIKFIVCAQAKDMLDGVVLETVRANDGFDVFMPDPLPLTVTV